MTFIEAMDLVKTGSIVTRLDQYEGERTIDRSTSSIDSVILFSDYIATDWLVVL